MVDNNGAALEPAIEQTIEFTTYLAPILQGSEVTLVSKKSLIVSPPITSKLSLAYDVPLIPFIKIK